MSKAGVTPSRTHIKKWSVTLRSQKITKGKGRRERSQRVWPFPAKAPAPSPAPLGRPGVVPTNSCSASFSLAGTAVTACWGHVQDAGMGSYAESASALDPTSHILITERGPVHPRVRTCLPLPLIPFSQVPLRPRVLATAIINLLMLNRKITLVLWFSIFVFICLPELSFCANIQIDEEIQQII